MVNAEAAQEKGQQDADDLIAANGFELHLKELLRSGIGHGAHGSLLTSTLDSYVGDRLAVQSL